MEVNFAAIFKHAAPLLSNRFAGPTACPEEEFDKGRVMFVGDAFALMRFKGCNDAVSLLHRIGDGQGWLGHIQRPIHAFERVLSH